MNLSVNNVPKLIVIVLLIVCSTLLRALDAIDMVTFVALVGPIGGYAVGNGVAAKTGQSVEPVFSSRHNPHASSVTVNGDPAVLIENIEQE